MNVVVGIFWGVSERSGDLHKLPTRSAIAKSRVI